jgi:multiple antibiotic resistance protein
MVSAVIASVAMTVFILLRLAPIVAAGLGPTGITILNRVMGLLLAAIAVEFIIDGVVEHFLLSTAH